MSSLGSVKTARDVHRTTYSVEGVVLSNLVFGPTAQFGPDKTACVAEIDFGIWVTQRAI